MKGSLRLFSLGLLFLSDFSISTASAAHSLRRPRSLHPHSRRSRQLKQQQVERRSVPTAGPIKPVEEAGFLQKRDGEDCETTTEYVTVTITVDDSEPSATAAPASSDGDGPAAGEYPISESGAGPEIQPPPASQGSALVTSMSASYDDGSWSPEKYDKPGKWDDGSWNPTKYDKPSSSAGAGAGEGNRAGCPNRQNPPITSQLADAGHITNTPMEQDATGAAEAHTSASVTAQKPAESHSAGSSSGSSGSNASESQSEGDKEAGYTTLSLAGERVGPSTRVAQPGSSTSVAPHGTTDAVDTLTASSDPTTTAAHPTTATSAASSVNSKNGGWSDTSGMEQYYSLSPVQFSVYVTGPAEDCNKTFLSASCGLSTYFAGKFDKDLPRVAMPYDKIMKAFGESQHNKLCGKTITLVGANGVPRQAVIADVNKSAYNSVDTCMDLWTAFGMDAGGGRFEGQWKLEKD